MVLLLSFYELRKQVTNKMSSLAQYRSTWVAVMTETWVIGYSHRTFFTPRDRETNESH